MGGLRKKTCELGCNWRAGSELEGVVNNTVVTAHASSNNKFWFFSFFPDSMTALRNQISFTRRMYIHMYKAY